jgi:glycosyltransferase involved in cell wall biosynthesis
LKEKSSNSPRISILTPSYNQGRYIEENIQSVLNQNYPNVEHIVIDGGSTDGTVEILKKYPHLKWVSEKDHGQADALNKGLAMATGEIIGWLNSDDFYEENIAREVVKEFRDKTVGWVIGNKTYFFDGTSEKKLDKSSPITYRDLLSCSRFVCVSQQATFFRRSFLEEVGGWNPEFYMEMDRDLWVRLAKRASPRMVDKNWAYFRVHYLQKSSYRNLPVQIREIEMILKREGVDIVRRKCAVRKLYCDFVKATFKMCLVGCGLLGREWTQRSLSATIRGAIARKKTEGR